MGFETQMGDRWRSGADTFESSLWDLKHWVASMPSIFAICLKVPYGIWNQYTVNGKRRQKCLKVPYGIWNLAKRTLLVAAVPGFESSLWDLKPFRFDFALQLVHLFESSLWDLKQIDFAISPFLYSSLKVPYGIWNWELTTPVLHTVEFESSLWDLKLWFCASASATISSFESSLWDLKWKGFGSIKIDLSLR